MVCEISIPRLTVVQCNLSFSGRAVVVGAAGDFPGSIHHVPILRNPIVEVLVVVSICDSHIVELSLFPVADETYVSSVERLTDSGKNSRAIYLDGCRTSSTD